MTRETLSAVHLWAGRGFGEHVSRAGFGKARAVYAFNTAALEIFRAAHAKGLFTVLEQTIAPRAYEEKILAEEARRFPGWSGPRTSGPATRATIQKEADEWAEADLIVCGSEFVCEAIGECGGPVRRCVVVPYGVDDGFALPARSSHAGPLRVLCVGEASLRKGVTYFSETAELLAGIVAFRWVGRATNSVRNQVTNRIQFTGVVPRSQVQPHYMWADVFFLPSVCEGSATVTYEALISGLPVVTTPNAGSLVRDGYNGFICPVGDVATMAERLKSLATDRQLLNRMREAAMESRHVASLESYQKRLLAALVPSFYNSWT